MLYSIFLFTAISFDLFQKFREEDIRGIHALVRFTAKSKYQLLFYLPTNWNHVNTFLIFIGPHNRSCLFWHKYWNLVTICTLGFNSYKIFLFNQLSLRCTFCLSLLLLIHIFCQSFRGTARTLILTFLTLYLSIYYVEKERSEDLVV